MILRDLIEEVVSDVADNLGRSISIIISYAVGVALTLFIVTLLSAISAAVSRQFETFGARTVLILPASNTRSSPESEATPLTAPQQRRLNELASAVGTLERVRTLPLAVTGGVTFGPKFTACNVIAATPEYFSIAGSHVVAGRIISPADIESASQVAVLGARAASDLGVRWRHDFGLIQLGANLFRTVGVLEPQGRGVGQDQDCVVVVPASSADRIWGAEAGATMWFLRLPSSASPELVTERLESRLRQATEFEHLQALPLRFVTSSSVLKGLKGLLGVVAGVGAGISLVSVGVGALGVANTMSLVVLERTREIGLAKALGATRSDVLTSVLFGACCLAACGASAGAAAGYLVAALACRIIPGLHTPGPPLAWIAVAWSATVFLGLLAGFLPAVRAANLEVIDALRSE